MLHCDPCYGFVVQARQDTSLFLTRWPCMHPHAWGWMIPGGQPLLQTALHSAAMQPALLGPMGCLCTLSQCCAPCCTHSCRCTSCFSTSTLLLLQHAAATCSSFANSFPATTAFPDANTQLLHTLMRHPKCATTTFANLLAAPPPAAPLRLPLPALRRTPCAPCMRHPCHAPAWAHDRHAAAAHARGPHQGPCCFTPPLAGRQVRRVVSSMRSVTWDCRAMHQQRNKRVVTPQCVAQSVRKVLPQASNSLRNLHG